MRLTALNFWMFPCHYIERPAAINSLIMPPVLVQFITSLNKPETSLDVTPLTDVTQPDKRAAACGYKDSEVLT